MPKSVRPVTSSVKSSKKPLIKKRKSISSKIVKKKPYLEIITALLSIPFLITVTLLNFTTLKNLNATPTPTQSPKVFQNGNGFFAAPVGPDTAVVPSAVSIDKNCKRALGPVSITSPGENDTVTDNPVVISIEYDDKEYCDAAWSYRINGGSWSGYDDRSVALYNLPQGQVTFDLRVKSNVTAEERSMTRKFLYKGQGSVLVPENPNSSASAN